MIRKQRGSELLEVSAEEHHEGIKVRTGQFSGRSQYQCLIMVWAWLVEKQEFGDERNKEGECLA